jgi:hypothetical protein
MGESQPRGHGSLRGARRGVRRFRGLALLCFNPLGEPAFAAWRRAVCTCRERFPERLRRRCCGGNTARIRAADVSDSVSLSASLLRIRMW